MNLTFKLFQPSPGPAAQAGGYPGAQNVAAFQYQQQQQQQPQYQGYQGGQQFQQYGAYPGHQQNDKKW